MNTLCTTMTGVRTEKVFTPTACIRQAGGRNGDAFNSEFTFHPRLSTVSNRIVEQLGTSFLVRQQRHLEKQQRLYEENMALHHNVNQQQSQQQLTQNNDSKPAKIAHIAPAANTNIDKQRPTTGNNFLKKRSRMPKNNLRKSSRPEQDMDTEASDSAPTVPVTCSTPAPPCRSKTSINNQLSHSMVTNSGQLQQLHQSLATNRKRNLDPYCNFDRLQRAKLIADKAVKSKKIFSIHGAYPLIRKSLRERGWVEKEFKLPNRAKLLQKSNGGDSSDADDDDDDDDDDNRDSGNEQSPRGPFESQEKENDPDDCYGIMGRMVRNEVPTFQWTTRNSSIDWKFLTKDQIVNHFAKANFTTKVGLCMNLRTINCFTDVNSDTFFPRCYRLSNEEDKLDFIDDFRLVAASSILKIAVSRHVDDDGYGKDSERMENGQMPPKGGSHVVPTEILKLAIAMCDNYVKERNHDDIDQDESVLQVSPDSWDQLIFHYSKLVHEGATIANSASYFKQCEHALTRVKELSPQFSIDGVKNTWIIKPGAKSRGRGILVMNRLEDILKLVSGDPNLMKDSRWVVQKYIERPLLIHQTKFDIRQWFLVTDWNPMTIWIYTESYLRFSSRSFTLKNLDACIHLCNYSVQKNFVQESSRHSCLPDENMWTSDEFKNHLRSRGCHTLWDDLIYPGMKKAIIHVCQTAQDVVDFRKGSFELYGADFIIDENYNPWLIEVNSSPTMARSTVVTNRLCAMVQEDVMKVVLDRKKDKSCDTGLFEVIYKQPTIDVPLYVGKSLNVEGFTIKNPLIRNNNRRLVNTDHSTASTSHLTRGGGDVDSRKNNVATHTNDGKTNGNNINTFRASRVSVRQTPQSNCHPEQHSQRDGHNDTTDQQRSSCSSPVRIRMRSTMKRLNTEAGNIPPKPNALNLPKQAATSSTSNPHTAALLSKQQMSVTRLSSHVKGQTNRASTNSLTNNTTQVAATHFISSAQSKAASAMGIMNLTSGYSNSLIAAANRGCLPAKFPHHVSPPINSVVPKTFPVSMVPGGDLGAGGGLIAHPPPPPGVVAVTPQNVGLGLPFQRYFSSNPNAEAGGLLLQNRRIVAASHHHHHDVMRPAQVNVAAQRNHRSQVSGRLY